MPAIRSFAELFAVAARPPLATIAIAGADEVEVLEAAVDCVRRELARPILVGPEQGIRTLASSAGLDLAGCAVVPAGNPAACAQVAVQMVRSGQARVAVKGLVSTSTFMHATLDPVLGLRSDRLISHAGVFQVPGYPRLLIVTDGGVVLYPTLEQRIGIVRNAIALAHTLGIPCPRVALLAGTDEPDLARPATIDIATLVGMHDLWAATGALVDGPMTLDVAVDPQAAARAGRFGAVAGQADVLVGPTLEATNTMGKALIYFAHGQMAGVVLGARAPLALGSRSDSSEARLACIAIGVLLAKHLSGPVSRVM